MTMRRVQRHALSVDPDQGGIIHEKTGGVVYNKKNGLCCV